MFNTLNYAKILEEAGFSRKEAEATVKILVDVMEDKLATKQDLQNAMTQLEARLTMRMGAMLAASIAVLTAIQKFIH